MLKKIRVAELFAGVGGFRLGLDGYSNPSFPQFSLPSAGIFETIWANQWEPPGTESRQFAWRCYIERFGENSCINEDIAKVLDQFEAGEIDIPDVDMVVGGFPCQDYSVAKPLSQAGGIEGKKGVLWWEIYRFLQLKKPKYVLLENVDRLLKSPAKQRGRDFAIILSCLANLGYSAEWRVINSAEYGFSQRRKRVYIYAELANNSWNIEGRFENGIFGRAFPIIAPHSMKEVLISEDPYELTNSFNIGGKISPFENSGVMQNFVAITAATTASYSGSFATLSDVIVDNSEVPESFYVDEATRLRWEYLKGAKSEKRVNKTTGHEYNYSEGKMSFPDSLNSPARTILTSEGGASASRSKHVIEVGGRLRRLVPDELDQLQGFPKGWTDAGLTDIQRAFCMGNALVVGIPYRIGLAMKEAIID